MADMVLGGKRALVARTKERKNPEKDAFLVPMAIDAIEKGVDRSYVEFDRKRREICLGYNGDMIR
jgi:hypothetical protein